MPDYYKLLQVPRGASDADIKLAYRRLALRHHPDQNPSEPSAPRRFHLINEAYQVLSDAERRRFFDRFGVEREALARQAPLGSMGQLVGALWDEIRRRPKGERRPGADQRYTLEVTFEEAAFGARRVVKVSREISCRACAGTGARGQQRETCHLCEGTGEVREAAPLLPRRMACPFCEGKGQIVLSTCATCSGTGSENGELEVFVDIAPGTNTGKIYRLRGCGQRGEGGGGDGDLLVHLHVMEHPLYRREGAHVVIGVPLTVAEMVLGASVHVPTLDGTVVLRVPADTRPGQRFRLPGRGLPRHGGGDRGDAFVEVAVELPRGDDPSVREVLHRWPPPNASVHPLRARFEAARARAESEVVPNREE